MSDNKFSSIKERVVYLLELKGIAKEAFYVSIGMSSANFRGSAKNTPLNSTAIANILTIITDANPYWLLLGVGDPLVEGQKGGTKQSIVGSNNIQVGRDNAMQTSPNVLAQELEFYKILIREKEKQIEDKDEMIKKLYKIIDRYEAVDTRK